jgi:hypothetical protein
MGTRELVKSGKLSVEAALTNFKGLRKQGQYVGDGIIRWLERRKGIVVVEQPQQQPRKNKRQKRKEAPAE